MSNTVVGFATKTWMYIKNINILVKAGTHKMTVEKSLVRLKKFKFDSRKQLVVRFPVAIALKEIYKAKICRN